MNYLALLICGFTWGLAAPVLAQSAISQPGAGAAGAATPKVSPDGRIFEPPPVPQFMLHKPPTPLSLEEMKSQADEAAARAKRAREQAMKASPKAGSASAAQAK